MSGINTGRESILLNDSSFSVNIFPVLQCQVQPEAILNPSESWAPGSTNYLAYNINNDVDDDDDDDDDDGGGGGGVDNDDNFKI